LSEDADSTSRNPRRNDPCARPPNGYPATIADRSTETGMTFLLNLFGFVVFISGAAWLATALGTSQALVLPAAGTLLLAAVWTAAADARVRDPA
jgi:hypothetical protein